MRILVGIVVISALVAFYVISYRLNRKQELPEDIKASAKACGSCSTKGCGIHPENKGEANE